MATAMQEYPQMRGNTAISEFFFLLLFTSSSGIQNGLQNRLLTPIDHITCLAAVIRFQRLLNSKCKKGVFSEKIHQCSMNMEAIPHGKLCVFLTSTSIDVNNPIQLS